MATDGDASKRVPTRSSGNTVATGDRYDEATTTTRRERRRQKLWTADSAKEIFTTRVSV